METSTTPRKKMRSEVKLEKNPVTMKYQYQSQSLVSKFKNDVLWITDIGIGHLDLEGDWKPLGKKYQDKT